MNIMKEIKKYSRIKAMSIPCVLAMMIGTIVFFGVCCLSIFIEVSYLFPLISGAFEVGGLILSIIILSISDNVANKIIQTCGLKEFLKGLTNLKDEDLAKDTFYYDIISILRHITYQVMIGEGIKQETKDANNCLREVLINDTSKQINKFVYNNREGFVGLCKEFLDSMDTWDMLSSRQHIMQKLSSLLSAKGDNDRIKRKYKTEVGKFILHMMDLTKRVLLAILIIILFVPNEYIKSLSFNLSAIFLLAMDIIEKNIKNNIGNDR